MQLSDKKILLVGASSGIAAGAIPLLLEEGAHLILTSRDGEKIHKMGWSNHPQVTMMSLDLEDDDGVSPFVHSMEVLNGVVCCAGVVAPFPLKYLKKDVLERVMKINFSGPALLCSELLKQGKVAREASVVFISSVSSQLPFNGSAAYSASKAAIEAFSRSLAYECRGKKVRSNAIRAGMIKTAMFEEAKGFQADIKEEEYAERYLLGFGEPRNVADLILFLLSDSSSWINGSVIDLDGGFRIG